ncbi:MAG: hypothetical protein HC802_14135, partial [Caldilineaceae bacterium]|nr:hypothetical protein [Caldilineaceae bacterium]
MTTKLDLALLRRYEPIIRFTQGEQFFPMDAEIHIRASSLWVQRPGQEATCLVESGDLDPDRLGQPLTDEFGAVHFLKLTDPLHPREM